MKHRLRETPSWRLDPGNVVFLAELRSATLIGPECRVLDYVELKLWM